MPKEIPMLHVLFWNIPWVIAAPIIVTFLTVFAKFAWAGAGALIYRIRSLWDRIIVECPISLGWLQEKVEPPKFSSATLHCLVVRYGNDTYLKNMASDQERYEGRLRNLAISIPNEGIDTKLLLPVHSRLGTQFKLYLKFETPDEARKTWKRINDEQARLKQERENTKSDHLDVSHQSERATSPIDQVKLDTAPPLGRRMWFVLNSFPTTETIDGYINNHCGTSIMAGFETRHRLARLWSPRRGVLDLD